MFESTNAKLSQPLWITSIGLWVLLVAYHLCGGSDQLQFGPSDDFVVLSIPVNTWCRFGCLAVAILMIQFMLLLIEEYAEPVVDWTVYNYQCTYVSEFTKWELYIKTNMLYANKDLLKLLRLNLSITRLDVMILVLAAEIVATFYTSWDLMKNKQFPATAAERNMTADFIETPPRDAELQDGDSVFGMPKEVRCSVMPQELADDGPCADPRIAQHLVVVMVDGVRLELPCQALPTLVQALPRLLLARQQRSE